MSEVPPEEPKRYRGRRARPVTRADRVLWPLFAWTLTLTALGIPGVVISALLLPTGPVRLIARCVLVAAVLTDLSSLHLTVTYLLRGGGLHGIALYTMAYYVVFVVLGMGGAWWWRSIVLASLLVLYVGCVHYLLRPIASMLGWRAPSDDTGRSGQSQ